MFTHRQLQVVLVLVGAISSGLASAQDKPVVGLIPKAQKPILMDGKLTGWDGAFVTPVHIGHPDFANRGGRCEREYKERPVWRRTERSPALLE